MNTATTQGKMLQGTVVKTAMKDTCTVVVDRYVQHPKYKKYYTHSKKFLVHDAGNAAHVGDKVTIRETRPISKRKRFVIASIDVKALQVSE
jgi:small subunit ribosomal protein S17